VSESERLVAIDIETGLLKARVRIPEHKPARIEFPAGKVIALEITTNTACSFSDKGSAQVSTYIADPVDPGVADT